ncbi:MAG: glycyl-radical enzyme activating protein [Clostridia bacterium]|nr:glycyl-radical enzyme activating protein [Clostridia bacterium]
MTTGLVSNIQKCCVHDGPGLRTVVFLMGCPLSCKWCQNPENLAAKPIVLYDEEKCVSCGRCVPHCPHECGSLTQTGVQFDRSGCASCGACVDYCFTEAKTLCGKRMTVDEVYQAVMRDQVFYRTSGGGVTLSGGEPTLHAEFCIALFRKLKESGIHTAMETCGYCMPHTMLRIAEHTDLFLLDFKADTESVHEKWTGQSNQLIKENMRMLHDMGKQIIIRIPLIPGVNDGAEFEHMMRFLKQMKYLKKVHILPFHQIGSSKYTLSATPYELHDMPECDADYAAQHGEIAEKYGFEVNIGGWDA